MLLGGIEAGGTKMVCGIGDENGVLKDRVSFPTRQPEETFKDMIRYFEKWSIEALGIACFGPVDLNRNSATYGYITTTPKKGWANCDIVGTMKKALQVPVGFDTDVNGAVLGEVTWGAARGCETAIYITIGTGVGVGVYCNNGLVHGLVHPEGGHILLPRQGIVPSIPTVWNLWPAVPPLWNDGEHRQQNWRIVRKYGKWRPIISHRQLQIIF